LPLEIFLIIFLSKIKKRKGRDVAIAYSVDLRTRVINKYMAGMSVKEICEIFQLGAATVYRWIKSQRKRGTVEPIKQAWRGGYKPTLKSEEYEKFIQFLKDNIGLNSIQLAKKWGRGMTPKTLRMWAQRLGITLKKNNFFTQKQI